MIIITKNSGKMLCNDKKFRGFASFGTGSSCVKFYKSKGHALNMRNRINEAYGWKHLGGVMLIKLVDGVSIDMCGKVTYTTDVDCEDGYERTIEIDINTLEVK